MAQIQPTDKFIVDRNGSTYKTTFQDIEESLDIDVSHEFNAEVIDTTGGKIEEFTINDPGKGFLVGENYSASTPLFDINFTALKVDEDGGLTEIDIYYNDAIEGLPVTFFASPITNDGAVVSVDIVANNPSIADGSSVIYKIRQTLTFFSNLDDDGNPIDNETYEIENNSAEVEIKNNGGPDLELNVIKRGVGYVSDISKPAYLEVTDFDGNTTNGSKVTITVIDIEDVPTDKLDLAKIDITSVSDGVDTDRAELTVTVGGVEKKINLVPGRGIKLNNITEKGEEGQDQIEIVNTITEFGDSGGSVSDGASVIVDPDAPTTQVYNIKDGTLWYNLSNGRLYVAVTYVSTGGTTFDWIDASPSSFNDSLRKNQDDSTSYNLRVERNEALNPNGGSLYAYHFKLEELPLIS